MKNKELIAILGMFMFVLVLLSAVLINALLNSTKNTVLLEKEIAEYRIDSKTGEKTFYIFSKKELTNP